MEAIKTVEFVVNDTMKFILIVIAIIALTAPFVIKFSAYF